MGVDPTTGIYTPDVSYQPTGAMGAVTSLLNAQKAQEIADTLQQQRQAQASMEQQKAQEYGEVNQRAAQVRQAISQAAQDPNATSDDLMMAAYRSGAQDPSQWMGYMRSGLAANSRTDVAGINAQGKADVANINTAGGALPAARAGELGAKGGLESAQTGVVASNAKARQDLDSALAMLARAKAAVAGKSQLTDQDTKNLYSYLKTIEMVRARYATDKTAFMDPGIAAQIAQLDKEIADTKSKIQAKSVAGNYGPGATTDPTQMLQGGLFGGAPTAGTPSSVSPSGGVDPNNPLGFKP